ncbi:MAG TPA: hypothetical protein VGX23_03095 [Actinocrinis sp.]|nr:hypothetical protein [Actinocrinis sp.]
MSYLDNVFSWAATRYEKGLKADLYALLTAGDQPVPAAAGYGTGNGTLQYVPEEAQPAGLGGTKQTAYFEGVMSMTLAADGTTHPLRVRIQPPGAPANTPDRPAAPPAHRGPGHYTLSIHADPPGPPVLTAEGSPGGTDPGPVPAGPPDGSPDHGGPAPYGTLTILGSGSGRTRQPGADGSAHDDALAVTLRLSPSAPMFG